jgi:hypothetical protein
MVIRWGEIWIVCSVREQLEFQFLNCFNSCCCLIMSNVIMMQNNSICQHFSVFTANSGIQILFKHSIILCTIHHLSMILDGPIKVPKQWSRLFAGRRHTWISWSWAVAYFHSMLLYLLAGSWWCTCVSSPVTIHYRKDSPSSWYHCKNCMHISNVCPFVLICKLLWHPLCTNFVISEVLMDDVMFRFTGDVQFVDYISDSNPSVFLN